MNLDPTKIVAADCETNGLLDKLDRVHLLTFAFLSDPQVIVHRRNDDEDTIAEGLRRLMELDRQGYTIAFHNALSFDIPAIQKVYPWFHLTNLLDTLILSKLKYSDMRLQVDDKLSRKGMIPKHLIGKHSLESWGYRVGFAKGDYQGDIRVADEKERKRTKWDYWNPYMEEYAIQDVVVLCEVLTRALKPWEYSAEAIETEHVVARILKRQEVNGVGFDKEAAVSLYAKLGARREEIQRELTRDIPGAYWPVPPLTETVPKRDHKGHGYVKGAPFRKIQYEPFNPTSRRHIARLFRSRYGWSPTDFTPTGDAEINDAVLNKLDYPEAKRLAELFLIDKRIGQIAEGKQAWLSAVRNGKIHGRVDQMGTATSRMSHSNPNLGQVPRVGTMYGKECRALFKPTRCGWVMVGADASGLELRVLAHYLAKWDSGQYAKAVVEGNQDDETDVHSLNCKALGMSPKQGYTIAGKTITGRNASKTWI